MNVVPFRTTRYASPSEGIRERQEMLEKRLAFALVATAPRYAQQGWTSSLGCRSVSLMWAVIALAVALSGCKARHPAEQTAAHSESAPSSLQPAVARTQTPAAARAAALPVDEPGWTSGTIPGVVLELETRLRGRGLTKEGPAAGPASTLRQTMWVADDRGKLRFETRDYYVPHGTEIRYDRKRRLYVLADPRSHDFWALPGNELATLLEGGPRLHRTGYQVAIEATKQRMRVAGYETRRSNARLQFSYSVDLGGTIRHASLEVNLALWHTADTRLPAAAARTLISLIALPFQDTEGWPAIEKIASAVGFPLRWSVRVKKQGADDPRDDGSPSELVTTCTSAKPQALSRRELALRPKGFDPATHPYTFGADGQTVAAEVLSRFAPVDTEAGPDAGADRQRP